jgi:hypothetical protein
VQQGAAIVGGQAHDGAARMPLSEP